MIRSLAQAFVILLALLLIMAEVQRQDDTAVTEFQQEQ